MKKQFIAIMALAATSAFAQQSVTVTRESLGSGTPGMKGLENATHVMDGIYHAPQYMPSYPTAATIWPRVMEVPCTKDGASLKCQGYEWLPKYGRGEYLYVQPVVHEVPAPVVVVKEVVKTVIKEVEVKPKKE